MPRKLLTDQNNVQVQIENKEQYVYMSMRVYNDTPETNIPVNTSVQRQEPIIEDGDLHNWTVACVRWYIHSVELPVFKPTFVNGTQTNLMVNFHPTDGSLLTRRSVNSIDTEHYEFQSIVQDFNDCLNALANATGVTAPDIPYFTFEDNRFSIHTTAAFRADYEISLMNLFTIYLTHLNMTLPDFFNNHVHICSFTLIATQ